MKKLMIVVALLYAVAISPSYAEATRQSCLNTANTLYQFATERDQGVSSKEMTRRAAAAYNAGAFNDAQYAAVLSLLGMIYSEYINYSPDQIRHLWSKRCK